MTNDKAIRRARKLKPGQVVHVVWLDSGRESESRTIQLARRDLYGRVELVDGDTLTLAMDVCVGEPDDGGNRWGAVWIPSVLEVYVLGRK